MITFKKFDLKKSFARLVSVYKNTHTGLKCLNANFAMPHNCRGGIFFNSEFDFFFFYDFHLQIIASISLKASVENSSDQWAIFLIIQHKNLFYHLVKILRLFLGPFLFSCRSFVTKMSYQWAIIKICQNKNIMNNFSLLYIKYTTKSVQYINLSCCILA